MPVCLSWLPEPPAPTPTPTHHHIISHKFQPPWLCVGRKCFLNRRGDRFLHANERSQATNYRAEGTRSSGLGPRVGEKRGRAGLAITSKPRRGHAIFMAVWPGCYQRNSIFTLVGCSLYRVAQKFTFTTVGRALFLAWPEAVWEIKFGWLWRSLVEFREVWFGTIWRVFNALKVTDRNGFLKKKKT